MEVHLKTKHIIMLSRLVSKMNIKLDLKDKDATKIGADVVLDIVKNLHLAESEFYELVGSLTGYEPARVAETDIDDLVDVLGEVVKRVISFIQGRQASTQ
jgi:hypothetical protein